jgi:hypothetical protein
VLLEEALAVTNNPNTTGNITNAMLAEHLQLINHINENLNQIKVIAALLPKSNYLFKNTKLN